MEGLLQVDTISNVRLAVTSSEHYHHHHALGGTGLLAWGTWARARGFAMQRVASTRGTHNKSLRMLAREGDVGHQREIMHGSRVKRESIAAVMATRTLQVPESGKGEELSPDTVR